MLSGRMTKLAPSHRPIDPVVDAALLAMCAFWAVNGTLVNEYLTTSWTYRLWQFWQAG